MIVLLYTIHVLICFFLIAVVLLQQGKGADLSVFGGGATQTAFGARGAATVLHKMTVISFVLFIITTLGIGIVQSEKGASEIFEGLDDEAAATTTATGDESTDEATGDEAATEEAAEEPAGAFEVGSDEPADATTSEDAASEDGASEDGAVGEAGEGTEAGTESGDAGSEGAAGDSDAASEADGSEG